MFLRAGAAVLALALPAGAAYSGGTQLALSAVVAKSSRISLRGQPASLEVSAADVARGYVELPAGIRIELWSNNREGLMLSFASSAPFLWSATRLVPGESRRHSFELRERLPLAPATVPGSYPWPVQVVATPL